MRPPTIPILKAWLFCGVSVFALLMLVVAAAPQAVADDASYDEAASPTLASEPTSPDVPTGRIGASSPVVPTDKPASTVRVVPLQDDPRPTPPTPTPAGPDTSATAPQDTPGALAERSTTPLEPIAEPDPAVPPKVETASFNGITPGVSTAADIAKKWGPPKETRKHEGVVIHRYAVKPFERVEVAFSDNTVTSIVVRFQRAFPVKTVSEQLGLSNIRPVLVSNELGDILGQAYPERGVLFAFKQNHRPGAPSMQVTEIVLEPTGPDPFVLRAETNLQSNFKQNVRDLDEAIKLAPRHARAHWLRSRLLAAMGQSDEAVAASRAAIALEGNNARFRVSHAQILNQAGHHGEAVAETARAITMSDNRPHVKARAQCLMGDLLADGPQPDWAAALKFHTAAIKTANPLAANRHPAIRLAAKEVLIDANLGAANDIAWGRWGGKEKAVAQWTRRAAASAEELIANDGGSDEHRFRVASRTLGAYVGLKGKMDPTNWVRQAVRVGNKMIDSTAATDEKQQMRWELGMALFNAVQVYQSRGQFDFALECGQQAVGHLEPGEEDNPLMPEQRYLLGRLHFRLGAIQAINRNDHGSAVVWFDKAAPLLKEPFSKGTEDESGRQGETLVSMGVSYWQTGQQEKAVQLTREGLALMKQAVADDTMPNSALSVPYENLATMQKHLGNDQEAEKMDKLAADVRTPQAADQSSTAVKQDDTIRR